MSKARVLPADLYDTLELSAFVYGGIGGGFARDIESTPLCAGGHMLDAGIGVDVVDYLFGGIGTVNDRAVASINARRGKSRYARVSFAEWCKELNVVRGE